MNSSTAIEAAPMTHARTPGFDPLASADPPKAAAATVVGPSGTAVRVGATAEAPPPFGPYSPPTTDPVRPVDRFRPDIARPPYSSGRPWTSGPLGTICPMIALRVAGVFVIVAHGAPLISTCVPGFVL